MAKLDDSVKAAVIAGYSSTDPQNPHYATSTMWEAWEMGRYLYTTGRSIEGLEKGRGSTWRTPTGCTFKVSLSKRGGISISRAA